MASPKKTKKSQVPTCPWRKPPMSCPPKEKRPSLRQQMGHPFFAYARGGTPALWNQRKLAQGQKEKVA